MATESAAGKAATSDAAAVGKVGFLQAVERPDPLAIIPPPPPEGSARMAADLESYRESLLWRDTPRWRLAASDANVQFPKAAGIFACAAGLVISQQETPEVYSLLQRVIVDAGKSTGPAKQKYNRVRPFAVSGEPSCVPRDEDVLRSNGAYPSGHASLGWAWALVLAELLPSRANAILARGYDFGESRVVCGVHWQSDIDAGRIIASAVVARLHANADFTAALQAARKELADVSAIAQPSPATCALEAATLASQRPDAKVPASTERK